MSLVQRLRAETGPDHERVDARYAGYDLADAASYTRFLIAHARALPAVEAALARHAALPGWRERRGLIEADLATLGAPMPPAAPFVLADDAAAWGALYVTEGSRLGGAMLARQVPASLPSSYLGARHLSGEWRALLAAIDAASIDADAALAGARATFQLYLAAADLADY